MPQPNDSRPSSQKIAATWRAQIMSGELQPGTKLPSMPQLIEQFQVANTTIQKALAILRDEGFIDSQQGRGVYVRARQPFVVNVAAYFAPAPGGYSYSAPEVSEIRPPADVTAALGLTENDHVVLRRRVTFHDGEPVELCWSYYPLTIAADTPLAAKKKIKGGAPQALADLGYPQREFTDRVSVRQPTTEEVEALDLPADVPVIRQFRVIYSDNRTPVEASVMVKGGHLYELLYRQVISEAAD
ncbi:GntR family transcriptional regulator [Kutzneria albida]|uniref:HTH gntR-type domain-containing protein n=1 Tax=Kutzneria albida DSM 43870 TaxID=1449976 RepID=W5WJ66_9PSEU|nr:GntR family transcriptional regulator [Kutzneria albida]AHH98199.1 hypothetical protein KALB_4837 [Kutzneria albida DSM 43870]